MDEPPRFAFMAMGVFVLLLAGAMSFPVLRANIWQRGAAVEEVLGSDLSGKALVQVLWIWAAVLTVPFVAWNVRKISSPLDRELGNGAFPLYLFHWIPRDWYYALVDWSRPWWHSALLLAGSLAALAGSYLILRVVDRPMERCRTGWLKRRHPKASSL